MRLALVLFAACGGSQAATPAEGSSSERTGLTPALAVHRCHMNGDPTRTDYAYVAEYRCPGGDVPLRGQPELGARARLGNVGAGPDGHVLDLYEVPCSGGAVRIYVDAYHCPAGVTDEVDPQNLTPRQLANVAQLAREIESVPFEPRAVRVRQGVVELLSGSRQVPIPVCPELLRGVIDTDYEYLRLLLDQLVASLGATSIELGEARDVARINDGGLRGVLRLYEAIVADRGEAAVHPRLAELVGLDRAGSLWAFVRDATERCEARTRAESTGMQMRNDQDQNVWPPAGPGCAELVACCEREGHIRDGSAFGPGGMMCLLSAAAPNDCVTGLAGLREMGACAP
jgi:hypothetical protein